MIRITAKGLAKYMSAGESRRRTILRDFKRPHPSGLAQARYYAQAKLAIRGFVAGRYGLDGLAARAASLRDEARGSSGAAAGKLRNNARAISQFVRHLPALGGEVMDDFPLSLEYAGVKVSVTPDLHLRTSGRETLVCLDFSRQGSSALVAKVMCQIMADACAKKALEVDCRDCIYAEVSTGALHRKARARARVSRDIEAACRNIAGIWPTV